MRSFAPLLALLLLWVPAVSHALQPDRAFHHYVRDSWSVQQGLPQISALSIAQDPDGYLWVGTQAGLGRFDGVRFVKFEPGSEPGLPGIWVRTLLTARDGRLWIGTYKGLAVYDGVGFVSVPAADAQRWPSLDVFDLAQDEAGTLWVATAAGLFHVQDGRLHAASGSPSPLQSVLARRDRLWVGTLGAVHRRTAQGWQGMPLPGEAASAPVNRLVGAQGHV
ncbi:MAG: GGDEF domain-containing protein, partial [Pseudomonadota bacterium]|nr:GGDEF domain-containing protein [Pseudomonadota bacterium]